MKREPARLPRNAHHTHRRPKKKFGFRSKQNKIDEVYEALSRKYENLGILASADEVLRGNDTIRLHVKKFKALKRIQEALEAVESEPSVVISKVSIPLSMKNQFQKKGFLVYTRVADVSMVAEAKRIFQQFDEFKKCEVARQTSDNADVERPVTIVEEPLAPIVAKKAPVEKEDFNIAEVMKVVETFRDVAADEEGWEDTNVSYGEPDFGIDEFCGSLADCSVPTGSPEFPASKLFGEGDCDLDVLDLQVLPLCPKISIGEAGQ